MRTYPINQEMSVAEIKRGDFVGFIFAQPGNDTTYMVVRSVSDGKAICYDPFFNVELPVDLDRLWLASDAELDRDYWKAQDGKRTVHNIRETLNGAKPAGDE
jgi:hypothetical protein